MRKFFELSVSFLTAISLLMSFLCFSVFAQGNYNVSTMHAGIDNNSFDNTADAFVTGKEKSKYYIGKADLNTLLEGESEDTKNLIMSQVLSNFKGACYGLCATMALAFVGSVDLPASNYYSIDIKEEKAFRNTVNYYHLTQYCENKYPSATKAVAEKKSSEDPLKQIVEYAKSGIPFILTFRTEEFSHALTCCGYEYDDDGTHRVRIIDCNKKDGFMYLLISSGYNSWTFDNSEYAAEDVIDMSFSTLEAFNRFAGNEKENVVYSAVSSSGDIDTVCTDVKSSFEITNAEGKILTFDNGKITGDMETGPVKYIANSDETLNTKAVFTVSDSGSYSVDVKSEEIDLTIIGDNGLFFTVQGKNIEKISASEGKTSIEGENMEYSVNTLSSEEKVNMVNICGAAPERVSFEFKNGVTLSESENGKIHVSVISNGEIIENDLSVEKGGKSITYSDMVKTYSAKNNTPSTMKCIVLGFLTAVFAATLIYTVKKRLGKKGEVNNG